MCQHLSSKILAPERLVAYSKFLQHLKTNPGIPWKFPMVGRWWKFPFENGPPFWGGGYQLDIDTYIYLGIPTSAKAKTKLCPALATCQFAIDHGLDHSGNSNLSVCHEWCPISKCTWSDYLWLSTILYVIYGSPSFYSDSGWITSV